MAFTLKCAFILQTILALQIGSVLIEPLGVPAGTEFSRFSVFKPHLYHGRNKRQISSTRVNQNQVTVITTLTTTTSIWTAFKLPRTIKREDNLQHIHDIIIVLDIKGRSQQLNLRLNRELIPKGYFEKHQKDGSHVVRRPSEKDVELCHYQGKIRDVGDSWGALSTCHGLSGVVFNGEELHYIEKATNSSNIDDTNHFLYSHSDLVTNFTCGYEGSVDHVDELYETISKGKRFERSDEVISPYNANASSRYVELILVVDRGTYKRLGSNMNAVSNYCKSLANIVNSLFTSLNIFIALVGLVVWTEKDEIDIFHTDEVINNFGQYRVHKLKKDHPHDYAHLLIDRLMRRGPHTYRVGVSYVGKMCSEWSVGWSSVYKRSMGSAALTVAHETGHNLGINHDSNTRGCRCDNHNCIMNGANRALGAQWSPCNKKDLANFLKRGKDHCLRNKPTKLFDSPVCGNGFLEAGEECDCGLEGYCNNPCCDPSNCTLFRNGACVTALINHLFRLSTENNSGIPKKQKGKQFTVVTNTKRDWRGALLDCFMNGSSLASIESEDEYQEVLKQIIAVEKRKVGEDFWLSGIRVDDTTFKWFPSGRKVTFHKWHRSQPVHGVGCVDGHCIEINKRFNNEWKDHCCEHKQFYICQSQRP